jgi:AbrB family looped-hinge helix DNA binding protein
LEKARRAPYFLLLLGENVRILMNLAKLTSKGQLTIPKAIRQRLSLEKGDRLALWVDGKGRLVGVPERQHGLSRSLHHLAGKRPVTVEEMKAVIRRRHRTGRK